MKLTLTLFVALILNGSIAADNKNFNVSKYSRSSVIAWCNTLSGDSLSYRKKIDLALKYDLIASYYKYADLLEPVFVELLEQSKQKQDVNGLLFLYSSLARLSIGADDAAQAMQYLDSASMYVSDKRQPIALATYYRVKGEYIHRFQPYSNPEIVINYQEALEQYERADVTVHPTAVITVIHRITSGAIERNDTAAITQNCLRLRKIEAETSAASPLLDFALYDAMSGKRWLHFNAHNDERSLDSAIFFLRKSLAAYETGLLPHYADNYALDLYTIYAILNIRRGSCTMESIDSLLVSVQQRYEETDSVGLGRICHARARMYVQLGKIDSALIMAHRSEDYLQTHCRYDKFSTLKINSRLLRNLALARRDYNEATHYDDMITDIDDKTRMFEMKERQLQYEALSKQSKLRELNTVSLYNRNRHKIYITICVLLFIAILLYTLNFKAKRDSLNYKLALISKEKEGIMLKQKLKEEQTVLAQLEKYEALSDFYLKEKELVLRDKDMEQLRKDKEELDRQVSLYNRKVELFEQSLNTGKLSYPGVEEVILNDISRMLESRLPSPNKEEYIGKLLLLDKTFAQQLRRKSGGVISALYIKYCVCFAIGMSISEVSDCFSIEPTSAYMTRSRLRKMFALGDGDLDAYLQQLLTTGLTN